MNVTKVVAAAAVAGMIAIGARCVWRRLGLEQSGRAYRYRCGRHYGRGWHHSYCFNLRSGQVYASINGISATCSDTFSDGVILKQLVEYNSGVVTIDYTFGGAGRAALADRLALVLLPRGLGD